MNMTKTMAVGVAKEMVWSARESEAIHKESGVI
jgi:hypothetical protein